jgi:hypothetical protein
MIGGPQTRQSPAAAKAGGFHRHNALNGFDHTGLLSIRS